MTQINLTPFVRNDLHILFVGLNPAKGSNEQGHYFSVNPAFWEQLWLSGLITDPLHKTKSWKTADDLVFGGSSINYKQWNYGITDLLPRVVNSDSRSVVPEKQHYEELINLIAEVKPRMAIMLHSKVHTGLEEALGVRLIGSSSTIRGFGYMGQPFDGVQTVLARVPFPHRTPYNSENIARLYSELRDTLDSRTLT